MDRARLWVLVTAVAAALSACGTPGSKLVPGQSKTPDVTAAMGKPAETTTNAAGETVWFYPTDMPVTYAVRMSPDGTVIAVEQRLAKPYWSQIVAGRSTGKQVHELLGPPARVLKPRPAVEEWDYAVMADGRLTDLLLEVGSDGVVQKMSLIPTPTM